MILLSFVVLALALFLVVVFLSRPNANSYALKLSGPRFHRWAVNFIFFDGLDPGQFHRRIHKLHEKYGSTFHCRLINKEFVFTDDLELIKQVFRNRQHFQNASYFRQALANTTGASMFASEGEKWEKKHAILQPMMKLSMIEGNVRQIIQKAVISTEILDKHMGESPRSSIEILHVLRQVTIDAIGEAVFGVDFGSLKNEKPLEGHSFEEVAQTMMNGINKRSNTPEFIWSLPTKERKKELAMTQLLKSAFDSLIANIEEKIQTDPDFNSNANDLVTLICRFRHENPSAKEIYPDQEIFGECFSFLGAGHDTTTYAIFWAIDFISRNPRVYSIVQREILNLSEKLLSEGRETINSIPIPTHAELESLRFLSAAIKESQRMAAFIPALVREATSDVEVNGLTIPKGFLILMSLCKIHLSDKYFERPSEMIPERWLRSSEVEQMEDQGERLEKISKADPTNFFGFGFGARSCFGRKFALTQIKAVLFVLFQHFHFPTPHQEINSVFNFGVIPAGKKCDLVYERLSK